MGPVTCDAIDAQKACMASAARWIAAQEAERLAFNRWVKLAHTHPAPPDEDAAYEAWQATYLATVEAAQAWTTDWSALWRSTIPNSRPAILSG